MATPLRTPFTDLTGHLMTHQNLGRCRDFEMQYMECLEAYGYPRGFDKCKDEIMDFRECVSQRKQLARVQAMSAELERQRKLKLRDYNPAPTPDSYYHRDF